VNPCLVRRMLGKRPDNDVFGAGVEVPGIASWTLLVRRAPMRGPAYTISAGAAHCTLETVNASYDASSRLFRMSSSRNSCYRATSSSLSASPNPSHQFCGTKPLHLLSVSWPAIVLQ
jgi:hypothetical protein